MNNWDVIIAGAGIGGAACALALAHAHPLRILLIERHPGPGNLNRGESLLPPATALLRDWGALDRCRAAGACEVTHMQFHHHRAGLLLNMPLRLPGVIDPYLVLPHPEIERMIVESAAATGRVEIRYRTRAARVIEEHGRVSGAVLRAENGSEERARARLVVGADGAHSAVRSGLRI
jgi:2-polyprenyl-6-methoxyphenol hydroxylase-like FAD-dependent oxidoreductase